MMIGEEAFLQFVAVDTNIRRFARFEIGKGGVEGPVRLGEVTVEAIDSRSDARPAEGMSTLKAELTKSSVFLPRTKGSTISTWIVLLEGTQ